MNEGNKKNSNPFTVISPFFAPFCSKTHTHARTNLILKRQQTSAPVASPELLLAAPLVDASSLMVTPPDASLDIVHLDCFTDA